MVLRSTVGVKQSISLSSTIPSGGPALKVIHMCLWSTAGFFEKFVTDTRNGMGAQTSCTPPTRSMGFVS